MAPKNGTATWRPSSSGRPNNRLNPRQLTVLFHVMLLSAVAQALVIVMQQFRIVPLLWSASELIYGDNVGPSGTLGINHLNA